MPVASPMTRSRASRTPPTYTSAARSATPRPCAAVVFAARRLAVAAFCVWFLARVRVPFAALRDGVLAAVRVFARAAVLRVRVVDLRAVVLRAGLLRAVDFGVVVVLVFSAMWSASL